MQPGLSRMFRQGVPRLNGDLSVTVIGADGAVLHSIPAGALASGGIGYVYERLVAIHYEIEGYAVEQRSSLGYGDKGIDLICDKPNERIFAQCKSSLKALSVSKVEELLFKASEYVKSNICVGANYFDLVIPDAQVAFPAPQKAGVDSRQQNKAKFAFLRHNDMQAAIRLRIREVPLSIAPPVATADA